jgi:outer membrane protein assembly factor BamB/tRNA A-37 threonylcarbamoyl transferase component Bud32
VSASPELGPTLRRDFEVREYLGKSGKVLKAYQPALDRTVVLKILNPKFYDPAEARRKFIDAGRMLAGLAHPNVVQVYGVEDPPGELPFMIMEWIEGTNLKKVLKQEGKLAYDRALSYASGILSALEGIHDHGIVHRNLKPENLVVDEEGNIKLVDFGLAVAPEEASEEAGDVVLGTPIYMSPEQVRGKPLDPRSDLYAAGVIFYEMLTGKPPFTGKEPRKIMRAHVKTPVPNPNDSGAQLPETCIHVLRKTLSKRPEKRYESAKRVKDRVRALVKEHASGKDGAAIVRKRRRKKARRKRARWRQIGTTLAVGAFVALGVGFWLRATRQLDAEDAPPVPVQAQARGGRAVFTWQTPGPVPTKLQYGYGKEPDLILQTGAPSEDHAITLEDLEPGRTLVYRVLEAEGRWGSTESIELETAWTLGEPRVEAKAVRVNVFFDTDAAVPSRVLVSRQADLGSPVQVHAPATTRHAVLVSGLEAGVEYHGRVQVREPGEAAQYRDFTFRTEEPPAELLYQDPDGQPFLCPPVLVGDAVVIAGESGAVAAVPRGGGEPAWRVDLGAKVSQLVAAGDVVLARVGDQGLTAVDGATGAVRWEQQLPGQPVGRPGVGGGAVAVTLRDGALLALDPGSGLTLWKRDVGVEPSSGPGVATTGPFELVVGYTDGMVRGFGPGGKPRWEQPFGARVEATPIMGEVGVGLVGEGRILRMRESRKTPRYENEVGAPAATAAREGRFLVLGGSDAGLIGVDWHSGAGVWSQAIPGGSLGEPAVSEGRVYGYSGDGHLVCLRLSTGAPLYQVHLASPGAIRPLPSSEGCYVATYGGQLFLLRD